MQPYGTPSEFIPEWPLAYMPTRFTLRWLARIAQEGQVDIRFWGSTTGKRAKRRERGRKRNGK